MDKDCNKTWPQFFSALTSIISVFSAGIHYAWPTPSLPILLSKDYPLNITSEEITYIITIASIGDIIGNILSTILADLIGRKPTIMLIALFQISSILMLYLSSNSLIILYFARLLGGVGEGACLCIIAIYIGEISEPRIRGTLISFFSISWSSGCLFVNTVGSYCSIETTSLITLVFPILFVITFSFSPESPYYCLMKNKVKEARINLVKLRRSQNIEEELCELVKDVQRQMSERGQHRDLFLIKTNRSALLIMIAVTAVSEFSGISSLTFYAQLLFTKTTDVLPENHAANLIIFIQLLFSIVSAFTVDRLGRRILLLSSIAGCGLSLFLLSTYFFLQDHPALRDFQWIPLVCVVVFVVFFNFGVANVINCLSGELFSASIKTKAILVSTIFYSVCVVAVTKVFQILSDSYSLCVPFFVFAVCQLIGWVVCWRVVPETKGKSLEEIQQEIIGRLRNGDPCKEPLLHK